MTSPNPYAPGTVGQPADQITARLRQLEQTVAELMRKDLSNANVGQGGRLRALYGNGNEALQVGKDPVDGQNKTRISYSSGAPAFAIGPGSERYGGLETLVLRDLAGSSMLTTDELAGYGLSNPVLPYGTTVTFGGTSSASQAINAEVSVLEAYPTFYHPAIRAQGLITCPNDLVWKYRLRLVNGFTGAEVATSDTTTGVTGNQYFDKFLVVPQAYCGAQQVTAQLMVTMTAGASPTWQVQQSRILGYSMAYYNLYPSLH